MAGIPEATVIGWFVSPIIRAVINKAQGYIVGQYKWECDMKSDLEKVESTLRQLLTVVEVAERQRVRDGGKLLLLHEIKAAVYDADDVVDEFEYLHIKAEAEKQRSKVRHKISSSHALGMRSIGHDEFSAKLKEVISSLERAKASANTLLKAIEIDQANFNRSYLSDNWLVTSSMPPRSSVGREKETNELIGRLLEQGDESTMILSIVGQGGIGKTTLSQLIYNDPRIMDAFDQIVWLSVPKYFDKVKIATDMLECVDPDNGFSFDEIRGNPNEVPLEEIIIKQIRENKKSNEKSFDQNLKKLQGKLESKKFLFVLDDVWIDENIEHHIYQSGWQQLLGPLMSSEKGSKVLMTCRTKIAAEMLGSVFSIHLDGLKDHESWALLKKCIFGFDSQEIPRELEVVGMKIAKKLKGSPLAIKVIGAHLSDNLNIEEWSSVLDKDLSHETDIMTILGLSYEYLPEHLKCCFAFCSLFPKGWHLESDRLVEMWIALGFVQPKRHKTLQEIGRGYFKVLVQRSFFEEIELDGLTYHVMHDHMNDLAVHVSQGEFFRVEYGNFEEVPPTVRHLSVCKTSGELPNFSGLSKLRTLIILPTTALKVDLQFDEFTCLRLLDLSDCSQIILPHYFNHLLHLRYLALPAVSLHDSPCNFYYLKSIYLGKSGWTERYVNAPMATANVNCVLHVDLHKCCTMLLTGINKPIFVRGRGIFRVQEHHQLDELQGINVQGELIIHSLENSMSHEEAKKARLEYKLITELWLKWDPYLSSRDFQNSEKVLEALKPNPHLLKLDIDGYRGSKWPSWLESSWLHKLESVSLYNCNGMVLLPSFGELPHLQHLRLVGLSTLKIIGPEFYGDGTFPSLKSLRLEKLDELVQWVGVRRNEIFPCLEKAIGILECPKLTMIAGVLAPLEYRSRRRTFKMFAADDSAISRPIFELKAETLIFLDAFQIVQLEAIQSATISLCDKSWLPVKGFYTLKFLVKLSLAGFDRHISNVITSQEMGARVNVLPTSLEYLEICDSSITETDLSGSSISPP